MGEVRCLAKSLSGHDKGEIFVVCGEDDRFVYLADGRSRTLAAPKKKNRRHVQIICHVSPQLSQEMKKAAQDSDIIHILRLYRKTKEEIEIICDTDRKDEEVQPCQNLT